ncbi:MAG: YegS/Rv2252/BmrU family lipid kinase [Marinoscillum sp.]
MQKQLFVINPVAGGRNKDGLINEISSRFPNALIIETTGKEDAAKLDDCIQKNQPEVVVVSGGDGTINEMVPILMKHQVALGIIPMGSANGLATELGIEVDNAFEILKIGYQRSLDIVEINNKLMIHMADLGLNANLVKRYEEEERRGFLGYAISALKELPALQDSFNVTITSDGSERKFQTQFVVIANTRMYGTGYQINPEGVLDDQLIEICVLKEFSSELITNQIFDQNDAKNPSLFEIYATNQAEIKINRKVNWQSDGEYQGTTNQLSVRVLKPQLRIVCPVPD